MRLELNSCLRLQTPFTLVCVFKRLLLLFANKNKNRFITVICIAVADWPLYCVLLFVLSCCSPFVITSLVLYDCFINIHIHNIYLRFKLNTCVTSYI